MSQQQHSVSTARSLVVELCRQFYGLGWVSGTGGGVSIRDGDRIVMAPSGVQKERLREQDLFELDLEGRVVSAPATAGLKLSACQPLFFNAFELRGAGAVLHSHSVNAMLATLIYRKEFVITHLEMMKGISGVGYHDELRVPIIDNTAHEHELQSSMAEAMEAYPDTFAVLVRRHGVYVWGESWVQAKTHAECYDYLFEVAVRMKQLGINPQEKPIDRGELSQ